MKLTSWFANLHLQVSLTAQCSLRSYTTQIGIENKISSIAWQKMNFRLWMKNFDSLANNLLCCKALNFVEILCLSIKYKYNN